MSKTHGELTFIASGTRKTSMSRTRMTAKASSSRKSTLSPGWRLFFRASILLSCLAAVSQRQFHIRLELAQPTWLVTMVASHWTTS